MINKVILVGNVGLDPEVRTMESGVKVARLRLATSERYTDRQSGERKEITEWHTITLWRNLADIVDRYVHKGSQLYIEGRLRSREWERDGQKHYATEIVADDMKLLGRRSDNGAQEGYQQSAPSSYGQPAPQPYHQAQPAAQPAPQPVPQAPVTINDDPDDLPF